MLDPFGPPRPDLRLEESKRSYTLFVDEGVDPFIFIKEKVTHVVVHFYQGRWRLSEFSSRDLAMTRANALEYVEGVKFVSILPTGQNL